MIKLGNRIFVEGVFSTEEEIEIVVSENADYIFGPSSIFLPKLQIKTFDGFGTIPDGFAVDLASKQWYIVEAELAKHSVWSHIAPQVAKQITASKSANSRKLIAKLVIDTAKNEKALLEKFASEGIGTIHIHQVITEILEKPPVIGMPIDKVSDDLKDWAGTLKVDVRLWEIKKFIEFDNPENVIYQFPEEYKPAFDTEKEQNEGKRPIKQYDVSIGDLIRAGILQVGQQLSMSYKPERGTRQDFQATILEDGSLQVFDKTYTSPSYAAIYCIKQAGSASRSLNGWAYWKDPSGKVLSKLREQYLQASNETS